MNKKQRTAATKAKKAARKEISRVHHGKQFDGYATDIPEHNYVKKRGSQAVVQTWAKKDVETGRKVMYYDALNSDEPVPTPTEAELDSFNCRSTRPTEEELNIMKK